MRTTTTALLLALVAAPAWAQAPAPAAGSGGGGPVNPSVSEPRVPTGRTPPGAPSTSSVGGQDARNQTGTQVLGNPANPPGPVPGNTGGADTGATPSR